MFICFGSLRMPAARILPVKGLNLPELCRALSLEFFHERGELLHCTARIRADKLRKVCCRHAQKPLHLTGHFAGKLLQRPIYRQLKKRVHA